MRFYLGTHMLSQRWWDAAVPLFVSYRKMSGAPILRELPASRPHLAGEPARLRVQGHHRLCRNYQEPTEPEHIDGQESLL